MNNVNWNPGMTLEEIEKSVILQAFRFYRGNKTTTATALGIAIRTLDNKLEKYEADGKEQQRRDEKLRAEQESFLARSRGPRPEHLHEKAPLLHSPDAGPRMESAVEVSAKQAVPMPERAKVQTVPSQHAAQGHTRKAR